MHATPTVHAVPDLRIAGGRLGGRFTPKISITSEVVCGDRESVLSGPKTAHAVTVKSRRLKLTAQPSSIDRVLFSLSIALGTRRLLVSLIN